MSTRCTNTEAALLAVYDGQEAIGFIIRRGSVGIEAFAADGRSIGMFSDEGEAATAVWRYAHGQTSDEPVP
jgi:hypothetical protein